MTIVREGQAPYAPTEAVMTVIDGYRTKHPQTPFTVENIQPLGVATSIAPRTLQALRLLDLVDDTGQPTAGMDVLREASVAEFPERLAEILRAAYAEVFAYKDPAQDTPEGLAEVFRFYKPPSMQPRMVRLFYGLCIKAGLIESAPAVATTGKTSARKSPAARTAARADKALRGSTAPPPPPPAPPPPPPPPPPPKDSLDQLRAKYVETLLDKLAKSDGDLDSDLADRIERLLSVQPAQSNP